MIAGVVFGKYMQLTKRLAGEIAVCLMLVGNLLLATFRNLIVFIVADILIAIGFGFFMPYVMSAVNRSSTKATSAIVTSLTLAAGSVANFLSTYVYEGFSRLFGQTANQFGFWCGAFFCVLLMIELGFMLKKKLL